MSKHLEANITFSKFCNKYNAIKNNLPVRPSEMGVLNIIIKNDGLFTPVMIAELLEVSKPMVTAHIRRLEKLGYVYKEYSKEDKRSFFVLPTDKAHQLVIENGKEMKTRLEQLEAAMGSKDFDNMVTLLAKANKIITDMEEK